MWRVSFVPEARNEFLKMPDREQAAMSAAILKLEVEGDQLGAPHSSNVEGVTGYLRELRPRRGSSPWRAFYRLIEDRMVIGSVGPEANVDRRGFNRAVSVALTRLDEFGPAKE